MTTFTLMDGIELMDRDAAFAFARHLESETLVTQVENDDADGDLVSQWVFAHSSIPVDEELVPYFNAINSAAEALLRKCESSR